MILKINLPPSQPFSTLNVHEVADILTACVMFQSNTLWTEVLGGTRQMEKRVPSREEKRPQTATTVKTASGHEQWQWTLQGERLREERRPGWRDGEKTKKRRKESHLSFCNPSDSLQRQLQREGVRRGR